MCSFKVFLAKLRKAEGKQDKTKAALIREKRPTYKLDHIVRERYIANIVTCYFYLHWDFYAVPSLNKQWISIIYFWLNFVKKYLKIVSKYNLQCDYFKTNVELN